MSFNFSFVLDKAYFTECFEQSEMINLAPKRKLIFASLMFVTGFILHTFIESSKFPAYLLMGIGVLELIAYYYRKPWWVTRQMWSRSANVTVTLIIDEEKIATQSIHHQLSVKWADLIDLIDTPLGLIIVTRKQGRHYLSKKYLNEDSILFIRSAMKS
ncbi:YcxB family protein [Pseudoalteromonas ulvae]|uniref:YcxB-like protein domain-containing protein n=1 Tax=Pseudoalteromonas ulvae TaxID=107327 RepID=A0A244CUT0_PSEDV|nr:YcxB family protein [Pseudoalteromonas ulvae]OUL59196.1 hypothetical protein B1199_02670 [Pseudoalteromonas ulvae]